MQQSWESRFYFLSKAQKVFRGDFRLNPRLSIITKIAEKSPVFVEQLILCADVHRHGFQSLIFHEDPFFAAFTSTHPTKVNLIYAFSGNLEVKLTWQCTFKTIE